MPVKHDVQLIAFVLTPISRVEPSHRLRTKPDFSFQAVRVIYRLDGDLHEFGSSTHS